MNIWELLFILAMIGLNGVFAAYEIALASVSIIRLQLLAKENAAGGKAALYMKENFEASLATVQVGITLLGAIAAATGGAGAQESIQPFFKDTLGFSPAIAYLLALASVVIPITVVTIVFGELVPKVFAFRNKEFVCLRLSPGMRIFTFSVWPAIWILENSVQAIMRLSELGKRREVNPHAHEAAELQTLRSSVTLARASRLIGERQETIILRAAKLSGRPIREIMLPAQYITMLDDQMTLADSLIAVHLDMHTRFPVTERKGDPQSIIGYINLKDLLAIMHMTRGGEPPTLRSILRPFPQLPETLPIPACLERMTREHTHIALVVDAKHAVVGMITLEDILEELVGEIEDEYDRLPAHVTPSGPSWIVGGGIGLVRLKELTGFDLAADLPPNGAATLSDWILGHLGHGVTGGEEIQHHGVRVMVRKIRRQKVLEAQIAHAEFSESKTAPM